MEYMSGERLVYGKVPIFALPSLPVDKQPENCTIFALKERLT
jgi:hypothetical protein